MSTPFIIAIDGYSSCGKSTLARAAAAELDFVYVDSGAMYRAVTFYFLQKNIDLEDPEQISNALDDVQIELGTGKESEKVWLNGRDISNEIRQMPVSNLVSTVSAIPAVRRKMVKLQKEMGKKGNIVMDGRDIGTKVFPQAPLKIFMTAQPHIRAQRRYDELRKKGETVSLEEVYRNLLDRDRDDTTRKESPLVQAPDALVLDNSEMSRREQLEWIMEKVKNRS
ncbi:MAG TPA: (d)CMP kinase [Anseongella sp.]